MLRTILSVSGKPGLFKLISQGKNLLIIESLTDGKRIPAYARDKVIALGDIAIYTETSEVPLYDVLTAIVTKEDGKPVGLDALKTPDELRAYLNEVLPDFDRERVYPTDIKRLLTWYNLLINAGITEFKPKENNDGPTDDAGEPVAEPSPKEPARKSSKESAAAKKQQSAAPKPAKQPAAAKTTTRAHRKQG